MKKKALAILSTILIITLLSAILAACGDKDKTAPSGDKTVITVAGSWADCAAIEVLATEFTKQNPNCTILYENIQAYSTNLVKRTTGDNKIDLFFTSNIQGDSEELAYALDLSTRTDLDLSNTFKGLIDNFKYRVAGQEATSLYSVPVGAEMRGLYVNKTLLGKVGITSVPTNQGELLAACRALKDAGYTAR